MLIEFAVENFMSFNSMTKLSMLATREKGAPAHCLPLESTDGKSKVTKLAVLFGPNASGKSNLLFAFEAMTSMVESLGIKQVGRRNEKLNIIYKPFRFLKEKHNSPTLFQTIYEWEGIAYRYGFIYNSDGILEEWLFHGFGNLEQLVFHRDSQKITYGTNEDDFKASVEKFLTPQSLLLSICEQAEVPLASHAVKFFLNITTASSSHIPLGELLSNEVFLPALTVMLQYADTGIFNLECREESVDKNLPDFPDDMPDELLNALKAVVAASKTISPTRQNILFHHSARDSNLSPEDLTMEETEESEGTQRFLRVLTGICKALKKDGLYIIDEIDQGFHHLLVGGLIDFFTSIKGSKAQILCTTHCASLFNNRTMRRDELWLVEKDGGGESFLQSVSDFKDSRPDGNLMLRYSNGRFGGIPILREEALKKGSKMVSDILLSIKKGKINKKDGKKARSIIPTSMKK